MMAFFRPNWDTSQSHFITDLLDINCIILESFESEIKRELSATEQKEFLSFFNKGKCKEQLKCATSYKIEVHHKQDISSYYLHHNSLGPKPGGLRQVVFTPKQTGLLSFIKALRDET